MSHETPPDKQEIETPATEPRIDREFERLEKTEQQFFVAGLGIYQNLMKAAEESAGRPDNFSPDAVSKRAQEKVISLLAKYPAPYAASHFFRAVGLIDRASENNGNESLIYEKQVEFLEDLVARAHNLSEEDLGMLMSQDPVFYRDVQGIKEVNLSEDVLQNLPQGFRQSPSMFIESAPTLSHGYDPAGNTEPKIGHLLAFPYDWTNIRKIGDYAFKRVNALRVAKPLEEMEKCEEINRHLSAVGELADFVKTPAFLGHVINRGNIYLVSRYVDGLEEIQFDANREEVLEALARLKFPMNFEMRNIRVRRNSEGKDLPQPEYYLFDFETSDPAEVLQKNLPSGQRFSTKKPKVPKPVAPMNTEKPQEERKPLHEYVLPSKPPVAEQEADQPIAQPPQKSLTELKEENRALLGLNRALTPEERNSGVPAGRLKKRLKEEKLSAKRLLEEQERTRKEQSLAGKVTKFWKKITKEE